MNDFAPAARPLDAGQKLLGLLRGLPLEGFERSFKLVEGAVLTDRFLAGIHKSDISPAALYALCGQMGMPQRFVEAFKANAQGANAFHFGYEGTATSGLYKVYLEYASRLGALGENGVSNDPILLHLAYKWDVLNPATSTIARYECSSGIAPGGIAEKLERIYSGRSGDDAFDAVKEIIGVAAVRTPAPLMYLEVSEETTPRASFDIKLHDAGLLIREVESRLRSLTQYFGLPPGRLNTVLSALAEKQVGHLSGGINREGKDFLTVYYPAEAP